jgi:predicted Zn-dependent peptidase
MIVLSMVEWVVSTKRTLVTPKAAERRRRLWKTTLSMMAHTRVVPDPRRARLEKAMQMMWILLNTTHPSQENNEWLFEQLREVLGLTYSCKVYIEYILIIITSIKRRLAQI